MVGGGGGGRRVEDRLDLRRREGAVEDSPEDRSLASYAVVSWGHGRGPRSAIGSYRSSYSCASARLRCRGGKPRSRRPYRGSSPTPRGITGKRRTPRATRRPSRSSPQVGSFWDIPGGSGGRGACLPRPRHRRLPPRPRVLYPGSETGTNSAHRFNHGETDMGDKGSKDKGKREQQKKAQLSPKEKRKLKKEKKKK